MERSSDSLYVKQGEEGPSNLLDRASCLSGLALDYFPVRSPKFGNTMLANYGYSDGSGNYFITVDTEKCNGCGDCVSACPAGVFQVVYEDPADPINDRPLATFKPDKKNKIKYECGPCKPPTGRPPLPCVAACMTGAISHSW